MKRNKLPLRIVAQEAGVSVSTVSRYVRGDLVLSPETEHKIIEAARTLDYPLRLSTNQRKRSIGVIVPNLSNSFFSVLVDAIVQTAHGLGYRVVVESTHNSIQRQMDYVISLRDYLVDGILYCAHTAENEVLKEYVKRGGHVVLVDEDVPELDGVSRVFVNNYEGMRQGTRYLLQCGHRRIGYIGGPSGLMTAQERQRGFFDEMAAWNIMVPSEWAVSGDFSTRVGREYAEILWAHGVTAIVASDDTVAVGVLQYCQESRVMVPDQLSIMGFDDVSLASLLMPALTTIHQPIEELGRRSVELLLAKIEDPSQSPTTLTLPVSLMMRQSVRSIVEPVPTDVQ